MHDPHPSFPAAGPAGPVLEKGPPCHARRTGRPVRFGGVALPSALESFRREMNGEMMALLRSLPEAVHTDAVVFLMQHFRMPFFPAFNFFGNYHAPAWSILYWLEQRWPEHDPPFAEARRRSRTAHAMALFLHPLDDHLNDAQLPATHLILLLRSQAWSRMQQALDDMADAVAGGTEIVRGFLNDYYASIGSPPAEETLAGYCAHFLKQMATWMIAPVLMAATHLADEAFTGALKAAYGAFGIAWRLLDDVQDMDIDMAGGTHSAVYFCLPAEIRAIWDRRHPDGDAQRLRIIRDAIHSEGVVEVLTTRIQGELASAAAALEAIRMKGLAEEMRRLAGPLSERPAAS